MIISHATTTPRYGARPRDGRAQWVLWASLPLLSQLGCAEDAQPVEAPSAASSHTDAGASAAAATDETVDPEHAPSAVEPAASGSLAVHLEDSAGRPLDELVLACTGGCVSVVAAATGGAPPYSFAWSDGSTRARREVCHGDASLEVTVTDSGGVRTTEFALTPDQASASLSTRSESCAEPERTPACRVPANTPCELDDGIRLPEDVTVDVLGSPRFYADGASLPAGRYRLSYLDGCNTYGIGGGWTVHGIANLGDLASCNLIDADGQHVARTPGTTGIFADASATGETAYATYEACVEANCALPPIDFDFAGGKLAVRRDGAFVGALDDASGESVGGRSPTFRLTSLDHCP